MEMSVNFNSAPPVHQEQQQVIPQPQPHNPHQEQVTLEEMQVLLNESGIKTLLLVNRLSNVAVPVLVHGDHYYYHSRGSNIWFKHALTTIMLDQAHKDLWDAYFYFIDLEQVMRRSLLQVDEEGVFVPPPGSQVSLQLTP